VVASAVHPPKNCTLLLPAAETWLLEVLLASVNAWEKLGSEAVTFVAATASGAYE